MTKKKAKKPVRKPKSEPEAKPSDPRTVEYLDLLKKLGPCRDGLIWLTEADKSMSIQRLWNMCPRMGFMFWLDSTVEELAGEDNWPNPADVAEKSTAIVELADPVKESDFNQIESYAYRIGRPKPPTLETLRRAVDKDLDNRYGTC